VKVFVTGATGYIGGSVAAKLLAQGHHVRGLTRTDDGASGLKRLGIEPVVGHLIDQALVAEEARQADAVVNAANSDDPAVVEAALQAIEGSGKPYIQTSGSSIIADRAGGEASDKIFHEDTPFEPLPERAGRAAIDRLVLSYGQRGVRSCVIRPTLIYGRGLGLNPNSIQVPRLIALAKAKGRPLHIGRGLNVWSNVHLEDVTDLYLIALEKAPPGSLFYAENGEASMREVAGAIGRLLGLGPPEAWPMAEAVREWGMPAFATFASNSRVSALKARAMLGWRPRGLGLLEDIEQGSYRKAPAA
jgi:nucleoside-diphosphate-sugar epimerase